MKKTVAVLMTVYNRRETTLIGLGSLHKSMAQCIFDYEFDVYLVDDGSTDGTGEAVLAQYPLVKVIRGNGGLYWGGGMNLAWKEATKSRDYDYYLWMNDDANLYPESVSHTLCVEEQAGDRVIVCGIFEDETHQLSYGARNRSGNWLYPGSLEPVYYINGNFVLIPKAVKDSIGFIDNFLYHRGGDYDYGLRARKEGFGIRITDKIIGITPRHDGDKTPYYSRELSLPQRVRLLYSKKYSVLSTFRFNKRHNGTLYASRKFLKANFFTLFPIIKNMNSRKE